MLIDLIHRFRALFHSNAVESEWNEELRYHLDREAEKYRQAGVAPEEAMRRARSLTRRVRSQSSLPS